MWRYDASRTAASPAELPADLHLLWVRQLPEPSAAWSQEQYKLQFDRSYEPVVMGKQIFVPSMVSDKVAAYNTNNGKRNWQFFCDGPVRFAPIAWQGRVYFVSDDGYLYCLNAKKGTLLWKFRLAPSGRKVLGNGRLISTWPARGGPVLYDGKIYCAASIWPFMGVFIYALDAKTGRVIWENSGTGSTYIQQQHSSPAFGAVAPQGYMVAAKDKLLVTSRTIPACFDRNTGELLYYHLSDRSYGKYVGGYNASIWDTWYFNNGVAYRLSDGIGLGRISVHVVTEDAVVCIDDKGDVVGYGLVEVKRHSSKDKQVKIQLSAGPLWEVQTPIDFERIYLQAGNRLYGGNSQGVIAAIEIPDANDPAKIVWRGKIRGQVWNMLAGDKKLFVVTEEGRLYCFGARKTQPRYHKNRHRSLQPASHEQCKYVKRMLEQHRNAQGYCLWFGARPAKLLMEALRQSKMHIIAVEPDAKKVASLRRRFDRAGLYGSRVAVLHGDLDSVHIPPYLASLIVVQKPARAGLAHPLGASCENFAERVYSLLRPYSGVAWVAANRWQKLDICGQLANADLPGCRVESAIGGEDALVIKRTGPVPGSADWTHQYGDVANTVCSKDRLKLPLGILWFGEDSAFGDVLPRHGHGPAEQVVQGRLFIEGINSISARDVYTGQTLWKRTLKGLGNFGVYYDSSYKHNFRDLSYNQVHIPGANARGTNFVATPDRVYVIRANECLVLQATTGRTQQVFSLPTPASSDASRGGGPDQDGGESGEWGYIGVYEDYLLAGAGFARYSTVLEQNTEKSVEWVSFFDKSASKKLVVMNRYSGQVLWTVDANHGFIHNGIVAGKDKIFCLDAKPPYVRRKAASAKGEPKQRLLALDIHRGEVIWENTDDVFGSWLSFSEEFDILVQAHRKSRDMLSEPGNRMAAFRGRTGELIWDKEIEYSGPCMLHGGTIITQQSAYSLLTGRQRTCEHPLTGETVAWMYSRNYGCGTAIASRNLLTFRSAAAGYYDLTNDGGTGNFGGFRSGCTSNLVVANGVLNAPDYTRTCTCSYQNQTSLAMIHMPDVEMWTFSDMGPSDAAIERVGINFGAPGDRKADNGTLWLEYPSVAGSSPAVDIALTPESPSFFRRHSSRLRRGNIRWVEASGARGITSIRIRVSGLQKDEADEGDGTQPASESATGGRRPYSVHLHFIEPDDKDPGQRVFDVALCGQTALNDFDIVAEAQSPNVGIVKKFSGIRASDFVTVSLTPVTEDAETIICGIEIIAEEPRAPQ